MLFVKESKKGQSWGFITGAIIFIAIVAVSFYLINKSSSGVLSFFDCETHNGYLAEKCDYEISDANPMYGKKVDGVKMLCCISNGKDDAKFKSLKSEKSVVEKRDFGISATFAESVWKVGDFGFKLQSDKDEKGYIYAMYSYDSRTNNQALKAYENISKYDNKKPLQIEFANGFNSKKGDYCVMKVSVLAKDQKPSNGNEKVDKTELIKDFNGCSGKAYKIYDIKGTLGKIYRIEFIVYEKYKTISTDLKQVGSTYIYLEMQNDPNVAQGIANGTLNPDGTPIVLTYSETDSYATMEQFWRLNKLYCVIKPTDNSVLGFKRVVSESCDLIAASLKSGQMTVDKTLFPMTYYQKIENNKQLGTANVCVFVQKNATHFGKPVEVNLKQEQCDYLIISPMIPNNEYPPSTCLTYNKGECLSFEGRKSIYLFHDDERCYLEGTNCRECPSSFAGCISYGNNQYNCENNDCLAQGCYLDRDGINECTTCAVITKCSDYNDNEECLANACGIVDGCKWTPKFGSVTFGCDDCCVPK